MVENISELWILSGRSWMCACIYINIYIYECKCTNACACLCNLCGNGELSHS